MNARQDKVYTSAHHKESTDEDSDMSTKYCSCCCRKKSCQLFSFYFFSGDEGGCGWGKCWERG